MTTRADIINQAKTIGENFKANIEAPLCFHITSPYSDDTTFVFSPVLNPNSWDSFCSVSVTFDYCSREQSDDVGFFSNQNVNVRFRTSSMSSASYDVAKPRLEAYSKAIELMALLVTTLPQNITERIATHAERAEENKVAVATKHCASIVANNSKNMRIEGAKCLPVAPSELRRGEYSITRGDKKFNVTLTDQHTLLVRSY